MSPDWGPVRRTLAEGVGVAFPGAVLCVLQGERTAMLTDGAIRFHECVGDRALLPERIRSTLDTRYDLASLTKPVIAALAADAAARCRLDFDEPVSEFLSDATAPHWQSIRVAHLLGHTSGLPAHRDFSHRSPASLRTAVLAEPPVAPVGQRAIYSDIGYMALGFCLEARLGASLEQLLDLARDRLGLGSVRYHPLPDDAIAPTELCARRGLIHGQVHDPNAWALGGVAAHAGLFGTALDVARFGSTLLEHVQSADVLGRVLERMWYAPALAVEPTTWRLGWDSPTPGASSAGPRISARAVGHLGFTGTSLWIDPDRQLVMALLSNRVHPSVEPEPVIKRFRPTLHDAILAALA